MGKLVEIRNEEKEKVCNLVRGEEGLYLEVKCYNKGHSKIVRITITDILYQIWKMMTSKEKHNVYKELMRLECQK